MIIGVIGGVGAGKSSVLDVLTQEYQFTAYRTDDIAKSFYVHGHPVFEALKALLGADIERADGSVDLPAFAAKIYGAGNAKTRAEVDHIVHPAVWKYVEERVRAARKSGADIVVETALPTAHFVELCDEVWFVYTEESVRIARLMETRGYSEEKARAMIHVQIPDDEYAAMADFVVDNSKTREETQAVIRSHLLEG